MRTLVVISLLGSLVNFIPRLATWWRELNMSAGGYYLAAHIVSVLLLAAAALLRRPLFPGRNGRLLLMLHAALALWYGSFVVPHYFPAPRQALVDPVPLKVLYANVLVFNRNYSLLAAQIAERKPDVIALLEPDQRWIDALELDAEYPHRVAKLRADCFGIALFSKFPLGEAFDFSEPTEGLPPVIAAPLRLPGREVLFILLHTLPPLSGDALQRDWLLTRRISSLIRHRGGPIILAADLNAEIFSGLYGRFDTDSGMSNARRGTGLGRTWNAHQPLFRFTLDHVFYKGALHVTQFAVLPDIGSDHYPLWAEFEVGREPAP